MFRSYFKRFFLNLGSFYVWTHFVVTIKTFYLDNLTVVIPKEKRRILYLQLYNINNK